jgi:hypothetical protein
MFRKFSFIIVLIAIAALSSSTSAHSHTHVGRNHDAIWGNEDDNQLWIFATPDQPQWNIIEMLPTGEFIGSKEIYVAELDCWHSAHPETGLFQLDFNDGSTQPDWRIELKRTTFSDPANFWMEDEATTLPILLADGAAFAFESPDWDTELPNSSGGFGAWHFHTHTRFLALAGGAGETFSAAFTVIDTGLTAFTESPAYTMNFITVPEPGSAVLFTLAAVSFIRSGRKTNA